MRVVLLILAMTMTGCTSVLVSFRLSDEVRMDVTEIETSEKDFSVKVEFNENTSYDHIIQEGDVGYAQLVECWRTCEDGDIKGHDKHWTSTIGEKRVVREFVVYAGSVEGADYRSNIRFAMLPQNMEGTVVTNIDPNWFNHENYFSKGHRIQGRVTARSPIVGVWRIIWTPSRITVEVDGAGSFVKDESK